MIEENSKMAVFGAGYRSLDPNANDVWTGTELVINAFTEVECTNPVKVNLLNGISVICDEEQGFKTMLKRLEGIGVTKAKDLTRKHRVFLTDSTFEFDNMDLSCYNYINKINPEALGSLVGIMYKCSPREGVLEIHNSRTETTLFLKALLAVLKVDYTTEQVSKRSARITNYNIDNKELLKELKDLDVQDGIPEKAWQSKPFLRGLLKSVLTYSTVTSDTFSIKSEKDTAILHNLQQALLLFGVNSSYIRGLRFSTLMIGGNNRYRMAKRIGIFNVKDLIKGMDVEKIVKYRDITSADMDNSLVSSIEKIKTTAKFYELTAEQYVVNGAILIKI